MRYRPLLPRSSSVRTTSGLLRSRSMQSSLPWLIRRTRELEEHLSSLVEQLQDAHVSQQTQEWLQSSGTSQYRH